VRDERYNNHHRISHDDGCSAAAITETTDDNDERLIKDVSKQGKASKYGNSSRDNKRPPKKTGGSKGCE
jgi:hypothetical protein